ncbi:LicD family protein [Clostridium paraputrificum]|uniref:LicD family protein n=1 Tax=Clostridium paraputrificum TaxID=29363 RepID=UPI00232CC602|nr:LicD family protein [Clostridium paraputrificum]MDB2106217.1 LicD family protein [Clostridium paraputrificum]MDB2112908.1 LicD family protein [Clostridium paraputrificum]
MSNDKVTVRQLQIKLLEMIDYIDYLCKLNDIEYFLIGGSALGAVRHKGFIPWDDDFDIAMTYENYERFLNVCKNKLHTRKYYLEEESNGKWGFYYSKLKMNNTIFKESDNDNNQEHFGIFIDIFCLDNASNNVFLRIWQYVCSRILVAIILARTDYSCSNLLKKLFISVSRANSIRKLEPHLLNVVRKYNYKQTEYVGLFFGTVTFRTCFIPKKYLGNSTEWEFEGRMLPLPEYTDDYLKLYFGDYMKLPPENKRVGHLPKEIKI